MGWSSVLPLNFFCQPDSYLRDGSAMPRDWALRVARKKLLRSFTNPSPNFTRGVNKCEIWPRFSTKQSPLMRCGFETQQHIGKRILGVPTNVVYSPQIWNISVYPTLTELTRTKLPWKTRQENWLTISRTHSRVVGFSLNFVMLMQCVPRKGRNS